ncbi:MAG: hypothetical protein K8S55_05320 [Phycisphaerae bacterium]|nr:hypothetical protein [Phycisphaerae bacterium]
MARKTNQEKTNPTIPQTAEGEIAILQNVLALHGGQLENFNPVPPPSAVKSFIRRATLPQLQGTLVELLAAMRVTQE